MARCSPSTQKTAEKNVGAAISLKRNLAATYGSQLYMTLIGIVMLPFYVAALGVEAYGMVGLFVALQGWVSLLDFGLSPTLGRESARFRAGLVGPAEVRGLLRFVLLAFMCLAAAIFLVLAAGAEAIVHRWLHNETVGDAEAVAALRLMGGVLALRFLSIPLRTFLIGTEDLQWLGLFNSAVTTVKSVLIVPAMLIFGASLHLFFVWQLVGGAAEVVILGLRVLNRLPARVGTASIGPAEFRAYWRFSLAMAATTTMWVAATNADKVILSGLLPLQDYSMFSIAAVAAGGVLLVTGPFGMALTPRVTRLHAEARTKELVHLYKQATQLTATAAIPTALTLALFPRQTLWGWTGNAEVAQRAALVLLLYAVGNGLLAIGSLPLQLQIAAGRLRLHVTGTALFLILFLPMLWWGTTAWGMNGAGAAWLAINLLFVACWVPIAHRYFLPASHLRWLFEQVLTVLGPTVAAAALLRVVLPWPSERWLVIAELLAVGALLLAIAAASAATLRGHFATAIRQLLLGVRR
jgi:O-antigen/teichoic acid export membrane protein